ncbi:MAG: SRPBCC family protein [Verrucomicrobiota bacterium]
MIRQILLIIVVLPLGLAYLVTAIGLALPRDYRIIRELTVSASPDQVFPYINELKNRKAWSPYQGPATKTTFSGPVGGVGSIMNWMSPNSAGFIRIDRSEQDSLVEYRTYFSNGYPTATSRFHFEPLVDGSGNVGTRIVWDSFGKVPVNPFKRYYILRIDESTGGQHFKELVNLKNHLEGNGELS